MTTPTPGSDPNYPQGGAPQGQPGWGAPQQPQGYQPAPSYSGGPAGYGAPASARPPQVLVAAILGFVVALFALLAALGLFALSTLLGILALFGVLYLALAAVNIWGGVVAIMGNGSSVLKGAGIATAVLALIGLILALTQGSFSFLSLLLVAAGVAIFFLLNQPASQQFFASRGKK
ncbi:hypothetical protein [Petropleomorpha daqingensis]|uniref:Cation transport ATPase n=1 Tax=Petropleomorpha daqingensis TaxID=2026353 RepID=A0A853C8W6_9ACTN|nr:hypothetical protein [Petropleomorpha daqingensis]NYJ04355.1 cation transport ATPase [Petropleomorpha daqingensis]